MSGRKALFGLALILIGALLLGRSTGIFHYGFDDLFGFLLPLGLIAAGIWFIVRRKRQEDLLNYHARAESVHVNVSVDGDNKASSGHSEYSSSRVSQAPDQDARGRQKYSKFLGDMYVDCSDCNLESVEISGFLGTIEVNLSRGKLRDGLNRLIISHFIGDIRVLVPRDFAYFAQCSNFIGELELGAKSTSGFSNNVETHSPGYETASQKLYISANNFIGDIRIVLV
ncbi:MAG: cell wall-active antibiotics response protein LiaF [bacterium]|nr:cell wall-active antibiotics response protein LiaF [bacterium]